jgi:hypothetical protein
MWVDQSWTVLYVRISQSVLNYHIPHPCGRRIRYDINNDMVTQASASRRVRQMLAVFYFFGHPLVQSRQCQIQGARRWITHVKWKEQRDCCILKRRKKGHQVNCPYTEVKKEPKTLDYKEALSVVGMISHTHQPFHRCLASSLILARTTNKETLNHRLATVKSCILSLHWILWRSNGFDSIKKDLI